MRFSPRTCCLAILIGIFTTPSAQADNGVCITAREAARRALVEAKIELRLYQRVEYPRERRRLDAEIKLTQAEVDIYRERQRDYRAYERASNGGAFKKPGQDVRLCLLEAELRLKNLQAERNALIRFHSDRARLLELKVYDARMLVIEMERALEAEELPAPEPSA